MPTYMPLRHGCAFFNKAKLAPIALSFSYTTAPPLLALNHASDNSCPRVSLSGTSPDESVGVTSGAGGLVEVAGGVVVRVGVKVGAGVGATTKAGVAVGITGVIFRVG